MVLAAKSLDFKGEQEDYRSRVTMGFTRLDCHFFRGKRATQDGSSFVALNPYQTPGTLVAASSCATRVTIGSQVACKLSLEHFVDGVLEHVGQSSVLALGDPGPERRDSSVEILEAAFKRANTTVYNFGHKLAAGGRMSASLIGIVVLENMIAAGRVGKGGAYLFRDDDVFAFFEPPKEQDEIKEQESLVGANSVISVELASVPLREGDGVFVIEAGVTPALEETLREISKAIKWDGVNPCELIVRRLFPDADEIPFAMLVRVGPETIYLTEVI